MVVFTSVETSAQSEISLGTCPADEVSLEKGGDEEFRQVHLNGSLIGCLLQKNLSSYSQKSLSMAGVEQWFPNLLWSWHFCFMVASPGCHHLRYFA